LNLSQCLLASLVVGLTLLSSEGVGAQVAPAPAPTSSAPHLLQVQVVKTVAEEDADRRKDQLNDERSAADLLAQQSMAESARWQLALTAFSAVVGLGGLWALLISLKHTREATKAATQSARIAEETMLAGKRAWISLKVSKGPTISIVGRNVEIELAFKVTNEGHSPAVALATEVYLQWHPEGYMNHPLALVPRGTFEVLEHPTGSILFPEEATTTEHLSGLTLPEGSLKAQEVFWAGWVSAKYQIQGSSRVFATVRPLVIAADGDIVHEAGAGRWRKPIPATLYHAGFTESIVT